MEYEIIDFFKGKFHILFYGIALIFSVVKYRKYFDSALKYLPLIIGYTFLTEILGELIRQNENFQIIYLDTKHFFNNNLIYNIFDIIFFLYFYAVFWGTSEEVRNRKIIKYGAAIFIVFSIVNPFFLDFMLFPQIYALTIGSIILIISILIYFQEIKHRKKEIIDFTNLQFWISTGLLVFYIFYPAITIIGMYYPELYRRMHIRPMSHTLIVLMYGCFIIGFLKMRRMRPV